MKKITKLIIVASLIGSLSSCATIVGVVTGPFTGAYSLGNETWQLSQTQGDTKLRSTGWATLYGFYGLFLGIPCGAYKGFNADQGYFDKGHYQGSALYPPFYEVFYPFNFNHTH